MHTLSIPAISEWSAMQVIPTPLTRLRWWRVCLDEAQMVESSHAPATAMAAQLQAQHRWAVSGTPLSHDARDLHGLLSFLQAPKLLHDHWSALCQGAPAESPPLQ